MAQPGTVQVHIEIDAKPLRRSIKGALRLLEQANREAAQLEARCADLERRLAAEYGIELVEET